MSDSRSAKRRDHLRLSFFGVTLITALAVGACSGRSTGALGGPNPSPMPSVGPSSLPSVGPSSSPSAAPSPSPSIAPSPSPSPQASPTVLVLKQGGVSGSDNQLNPTDGDTATGGNGTNTIDGISCGPAVTTYHVHAHLSLIVNGSRIAIPDTIGMMNPGAENNGLVINAGCFYNIHTHDADGYIHVEAPMAGTFTVGQLFDIWGQTLTQNVNIAGYSGPTMAFTAQAPTPGYNQTTGAYTQVTTDPRNIQLLSHEEITLEVGPTFVVPPLLPRVEFYTDQ